MDVDQFDFELPNEAIALRPARPRDAARMLVVAPDGENLLAETSASGPPSLGFAQEDGFGRLVSGALEASNVEIVQEMVEMIAALRAYEIGARALDSSEQMSQTASQLGR